MKVSDFDIRLVREALHVLYSPEKEVYTTEEIREEMEKIAERPIKSSEAQTIMSFLCVLGCLHLDPKILFIRHYRTFGTFTITTKW